MIEARDGVFALHTEHTSYVMRVAETGHLEHLYYGKKIHLLSKETPDAPFVSNLVERHEFPPGNANCYDGEHGAVTLADLCLEFSGRGKGDHREPTVELLLPDGCGTTDFKYAGAEVTAEPPAFLTLPTAYDEAKEAESLVVTLKDEISGAKVCLIYTVFSACNVITRRTILTAGETPLVLKRLMSGHLDLSEKNFVFSSFRGAWAREMGRRDVLLSAGKHSGGSNAGVSSALTNPFFMLSKPSATEDTGEVFGFNLIYSGNHYEAAEVSEFFRTRVVWGIHPDCFEQPLAPGESFEAPEACMTYSRAGFNGMSHNFHAFVRKHVIRGFWRDRERPVLLNSWEACYFNINETKLLRLARAAAEVGIELFVMDDGWFGERKDDTSSLGDWTENPKKLPHGISGLAKRINDMGLKFGLWVEPEMVSVNSELYRAHPDWVLHHPQTPHSEGRNQRILDLSKPEVQSYLIETMTRVFSSGNVEYVKWDMNRTMTDVFSPGTSPELQGSVAHAYVCGLYRCMRELTSRFPEILFEGCAAGGNRFDLGILSFFPQIWGSDNTDALVRAEIQNGYSYGYPLSCVTTHVSGVPNHQTLRKTPLPTRYAVASFGVLGYEMNLCDLKKGETDRVREQVRQYKKWRKVFFFGKFYRGRSFTGQYADRNGSASVLNYEDENFMEWTVVSPNKRLAVSMLLQKQTIPNLQTGFVRPKGLSPSLLYSFKSEPFSMDIREFGDLINTVAPVHIKQDSVAHAMLARVVKMQGEVEELTAYGDSLTEAGVRLAPAYVSTGLNERTRVFPDYSARLYFMRAT